MSFRKIDDSFISCLMPVPDEEQHSNKYHYLHYIEFLEMLCRLALVGFDKPEPIEFKVYWLLELIWAHNVEQGFWLKSDWPLTKIA